MKRNFGLDVLRAFSISLVLLQHAGLSFPLLPKVKLGGVGVEVFFVLSGFLIGGILFREIKKENSLKMLWRFWVRRWFRILPLYYLILLFKFVCLDSSIGWNILYYVFFLQNNFYGIDYFGVSWSLVIEEWFYLIAPLYIMLIYRLAKARPGPVLAYLLLFFVGVNLLRIGYVAWKDVPWGGVMGNFPVRLDSLFVGVILAFLKQSFQGFYVRLQRGSIFLVGCIGFIGYLYVFNRMQLAPGGVDSFFFPRTLGFSALSVSIAFMVPFVDRFNQVSRTGMLRNTFFLVASWTSILTYGIYLIHPFMYALFMHGGELPFYGAFPLALVSTYIVAYLVYRFFEEPVLKLRERFS